MTELRWALLVIGLLFLAGLGWREFRRPRQARSTRPGGPGAPEPADSGRPDFTLLQQEPARERRGRTEPTLGLPPVESVDRVEGGSLSLPVVDPRDESSSDATSGSLPGSADESVADEPQFYIDEPPLQYAEAQVAAPADLEPEEAPVSSAAPWDEPVSLHPAEVTPQADEEASVITAAHSSATLQEVDPEIETPAQPEPREKVVVVRVVPPSPERFGGRSLRQAFADSGFVFGAFGIYHAHDTTGRTLASAANLMRPGTFDPGTMDDQWFHGLKLFIVLPGALPPVRAVDELVAAARRVAGKLGGSLQDDVGRPLTLSGLAQIKADLAGITDTQA